MGINLVVEVKDGKKVFWPFILSQAARLILELAREATGPPEMEDSYQTR
ncbi:MAG: hypothetical protein ND895_24675 [Pyrinomonadaceae bacterium]|nr:hypothetical protein [Pyrinomonadaceae bacterium]